MTVFLNGKFVDANDAKISVFDHGFLYGDGCFETLRTYRGKLFRPKEHLERLLNSATGLKIDIPWKITELEQWMNDAVQKNNFSESRLRITITRGNNSYNFIGAKTPTLLIVVTELTPHPQEIYTKGAKVEIVEAERLLPQIKSHNLLASTLGQQRKAEKGFYESLLINRDGYVAEGSITNFFIVKDKKILTAPETLVLSGITRELVMELAEKLGVNLEEKAFALQEALAADEAFLSGTTLEICPVTQIQERQIGDGKVGAITQKLMQNFYQYIQ